MKYYLKSKLFNWIIDFELKIMLKEYYHKDRILEFYKIHLNQKLLPYIMENRLIIIIDYVI